MKKIAIGIALLGVLVCAPLGGDVIVLKNGSEIQGEIIHEGRNNVVLRFPGGTMNLSRRQIHEIQKQKRGTYLFEEGEKAHRRGDFDQAIETLEAARIEKPESHLVVRALTKSRLDKASSLAKVRRLDEALAAFRKVLDEEPSNEEAEAGVDLIQSEQEHARDEIRQAQREIRSGDSETGLARLTRLHTLYPDYREEIRSDLADALIRNGFALGNQKQWARASEHLHRALVLAPERAHQVERPYVSCQLNQIFPLISESRFSDIEPLARRGLEVAPGDARLNYYLAVSLEALGKSKDAAEIYLSLLDESKLHGRPHVSELRREVEQLIHPNTNGSAALQDLERTKVLAGNFRTLKSKRFTIKHRNNTIGNEIRRVAERSYRQLFRELNCQTHWRDPCEIVVYPTKKQYRSSTGMHGWSGAAHELTQRDNSVQHRISSFQDQPGLTSGMLQHEIAHALLTHKLNYPRNIPLWANEGFAVGEGPDYTKQHYEGLVRDAIREKTLIPAKELTAADSYPDATRVSLFYAQSYGLVNYLISKGGSKGTSRFVTFVKALSDGKPIDDALREHYRLGSALALHNRWKATLAD